MLKLNVCKHLGVIPHIGKLSVNQLSVISCLHNHEKLTSFEIGEMLGFDTNEVTKIFANIKSLLANRHSLVVGHRSNNGRGRACVWELTDFGKDLIEQYVTGIMP